jgi:hypothetical protein
VAYQTTRSRHMTATEDLYGEDRATSDFFMQNSAPPPKPGRKDEFAAQNVFFRQILPPCVPARFLSGPPAAANDCARIDQRGFTFP